MSRLYLRIFLSFWLVIVLTIGAVLILNTRLETVRRDDSAERERVAEMQASVTRMAEAVLARSGRDGLRNWADRPRRGARRLQMFVFDETGDELRAVAVDRETRRIVRDWQREHTVPRPLPRRHFALAVTDPAHGRFLIVHRLPPRPILWSILGPLGLWGLIALAVVFSGAVCFWLARTISAPLHQMRQAGVALGQGRLDTRITEATARRGDELGDLARGFNHMATRLQKLVAAQHQLLRDVSHELRSPLARVQAALALAAESPDDQRRTEYLARIETELERLNHLIGEILGYSRLTEGAPSHFAAVDLVELVEDIADSARLEAASAELQISVTVPDALVVYGDEELLHRAIENVVRNAVRHAPLRSLVELRLITGSRQAEITVSDQGSGVADEYLEDIFRPFVRVSTDRGEPTAGGGIGLAIAQAAVEHHGGAIRAENRAQGGLTVHITLPLHSS